MTKMNEKMADMSNGQMSNYIVNWCFIFINTVIMLAYLAEFFKGNRTILYTVIVVGLCIIGPAMAVIEYKKKPDSVAIRHIIAIEFGLLYGFLIFTTDNRLTFTYVITLLTAITLYGDLKYLSTWSIIIIIENILQIFYFHKKGMLDNEGIVMSEIQIFLMIIVCIFSLFVAAALKFMNRRQLEIIEKEKENVAELLDKTLEVSKSINENVGVVLENVESLGDSATRNHDAMSEVATGTNEASDAVQEQLFSTENIQKHINDVENSFCMIVDEMKETDVTVNQGNSNIDELLDYVKVSDATSVKAVEELKLLDEYTQKMNSIIELINDITSQTSLLSLNASIEAARAGESGKGFAVVASEISNLAEQTSNATINITDLIGNISGKLREVVQAIDNLVDNNKNQGELVRKTADNFEKISGNVNNIMTQSDTLKDSVEELSNTNSKIVENIQTISAIIEEVTAHSMNTLEGSNENKQNVDNVVELVGQLKELADELANEE